MADSEVRALMARLQDVQTSAAVPNKQRLTERNCVEILQQLAATGRLRLAYTTDGAECVTPEALEREVRREIESHGGRLRVTDLPLILRVSMAPHLDAAVQAVLATPGTPYTEVQGEILTQGYLQQVLRATDILLSQRGFLDIARDVARSHRLDAAFVTSLILGCLDVGHGGGAATERGSTAAPLHAFATRPIHEGGTLYTEDYIRREKRKLRGALLGTTLPTPTLQLVQQVNCTSTSIQDTLYASLGDMVGAGPGCVVNGSFEGGSSSGGASSAKQLRGAVYIPERYSRAREDLIRTEYSTSGAVSYASLKGHGIGNPALYLTSRFGDKGTESEGPLSGTPLHSVFVTKRLIASSLATLQSLLSAAILSDVAAKQQAGDSSSASTELPQSPEGLCVSFDTMLSEACGRPLCDMGVTFSEKDRSQFIKALSALWKAEEKKGKTGRGSAVVPEEAGEGAPPPRCTLAEVQILEGEAVLHRAVLRNIAADAERAAGQHIAKAKEAASKLPPASASSAKAKKSKRSAKKGRAAAAEGDDSDDAAKPAHPPTLDADTILKGSWFAAIIARHLHREGDGIPEGEYFEATAAEASQSSRRAKRGKAQRRGGGDRCDEAELGGGDALLDAVRELALPPVRSAVQRLIEAAESSSATSSMRESAVIEGELQRQWQLLQTESYFIREFAKESPLEGVETPSPWVLSVFMLKTTGIRLAANIASWVIQVSGDDVPAGVSRLARPGESSDKSLYLTPFKTLEQALLQGVVRLPSMHKDPVVALLGLLSEGVAQLLKEAEAEGGEGEGEGEAGACSAKLEALLKACEGMRDSLGVYLRLVKPRELREMDKLIVAQIRPASLGRLDALAALVCSLRRPGFMHALPEEAVPPLLSLTEARPNGLDPILVPLTRRCVEAASEDVEEGGDDTGLSLAMAELGAAVEKFLS